MSAKLKADPRKQFVNNNPGKAIQAVCLSLLSQPVRVDSGQWLYHVPWRNDNNPSLAVNPETGDFCDRANSSTDKGGPFELYARIKGLDLKRDFPQILETVSTLAGYRGKAPLKQNTKPLSMAESQAELEELRKPPTPDELEDLAKEYGLTWEDFSSQECEPCRFKPLSWAIRYPLQIPDGKPRFKVRTIKRGKDGKRECKHTGEGQGSGIFPPSQIAPDGRCLYVLAGEEKALALIKCGYRAVSFSAGESGLPKELAKMLVSKGNTEFVVILDAGPESLKAPEWAKVLYTAGAESVSTITWPEDTPAKQDINDVLLESGRPEVEALLKSVHVIDREEAEAAEVQQEFARTDVGNANRLVAKYGNDMKWCKAWKDWMLWDGMRWLKDEKEQVLLFAEDCAQDIKLEAARLKNEESIALNKWGCKSEMRTQLENAVHLAKGKVAKVPTDFDSNPYLLNTKSGTLNLETQELQEHNRKDFITRLAPVEYDPTSECPEWIKFLNRIFDHNAELIRYLQKAVGYSMTGNIREQCFFILHGTGCNGKSTFLQTIKRILGQYAVEAQTETFIDCDTRSGPRSDIAALRPARMVFAAETKQNSPLAQSLIKRITGGEAISVSEKFGKQFEFQPQFKIWLATNHMPKIPSSDQGIWRRVKVIPFEVQIQADEIDSRLPEKLLAEAPGILNWALEGCLAWQREGLGEVPKVVQEACEIYRLKEDRLAPFVVACCILDPHARTAAKAAYDAFCIYERSMDPGSNDISPHAFGRLVGERFNPVRGTRGARYYKGFRLKVTDSDR